MLKCPKHHSNLAIKNTEIRLKLREVARLCALSSEINSFVPVLVSGAACGPAVLHVGQLHVDVLRGIASPFGASCGLCEG